MDGWAFRALDLVGASAYSPLPLANAPIWVETGDAMPEGCDCVVEAGTYITAGSKITTPEGGTVKAAELSGKDGLQFWRNSVTGALEVRPRTGGVALNDVLHAND